MAPKRSKSAPPGTRQVTWVTEQADRSVLQVQRARLKVVAGPDKGQQRELSNLRLVVGSASDCDLVLHDASVSRRHFEIVPEALGFRIRDLGSTNGTLVKDLRIGEITLVDDQLILAGESKLRLVVSDECDEYLLSPRTALGAMLGHGVAMRQVFTQLERVIATDTTVLLEGESGTGKDLAAETIHALSARKEHPFATVDCGTIQSSLLESELFGHVKGAFTGADAARPGVIESADSGTVFLDEIGELGPAVQPKLLRLLENREIKRLGVNTYRPVNVRLIAATNRDLSAEVAAGRFREDLFYRLSVVRIRMPALRDRPEDLGPLARGFVARLRADLDPAAVITPEVLALLASYDWPGNVRELRNVVERLLLFPERPRAAIHPDSPGAPTRAPGPPLAELPFHEARRQITDRFEKEYCEQVLASCGGVIARAAKKAGIARQTFYRLLGKYNLTGE